MLVQTARNGALRAARTTNNARLFATAAGVREKHTLPDLPYDYNALEPFISAEIMQLHHSKHHQAYVTGLNTAEEKLHDAVSKNDITTQISLQQNLKFNGGGTGSDTCPSSHSIFWTNLAPQKLGGGEAPKGALHNAITKQFGSLEEFTKTFSAAAAGVQGSGWGWLGYNKATKALEIATTPNQDPLLHLTPLLGVDVWEHAYYLQYKNVRPDYLKAVWSVVNWKNVAERYAAVAK
ncbi:Superoxide dismutase [Mn], mitochondrial [Rhizophlyctis rosea]|uniref:Superoxide dismutase n=1 Tax=Rhizophlyctis rosea TaxID=64517 RepID=A0AAD5SGF0_9FUNG|nr:Superoxide dismutase [Mn], mitochondrial [Rhizophlyctis rosea]